MKAQKKRGVNQSLELGGEVIGDSPSNLMKGASSPLRTFNVGRESSFASPERMR